MAVFTIEETALVLIDVQQEFFKFIENLFSNFQPNLIRLISLCRENGIDVVHVHAKYADGLSPWIPHAKRTRPHVHDWRCESPAASFATPLDHEKLFIKHTPDMCINTDVDSYLRAKGKKLLIFAGLFTHACVYHSAAGAFYRGYATAVLTDVCAAPTLEQHDLTFKLHTVEWEQLTLARLPEYLKQRTTVQHLKTDKQ